ncbi:MAG: hypothetical protein R2794_09060 [Chitinophagales bacterium]
MYCRADEGRCFFTLQIIVHEGIQNENAIFTRSRNDRMDGIALLLAGAETTDGTQFYS